MKKIKETEKGFYGCYWPGEGESTASWQASRCLTFRMCTVILPTDRK